MAEDPSLLRSDFGIKTEAGEMLTREYLLGCYREYRELAGILQDLERGIITIGIRDYEQLPAVTIEAWLIYKQILAERRVHLINPKG